MDLSSGVAYGGGLSGGRIDPIYFLQRPPILLRAVCWVFSIIIFGCISSQGWLLNDTGKAYCIINNNGSACHLGIWLGVIAFIASIGFIVGEYFFEQMSSAKTRKHYVMLDFGFSALWSFMFFVGFCYLCKQWSESSLPPNNYGVTNVQVALAIAFFSCFSWAGCAYFAYLRFKAGVSEIAFGQYEGESVNPAAYSSNYPDSNENEQYQEPPFGGQTRGQMKGGLDYEAPTY
ncbi:unnamed protein product [Diamesa serratosioi]